LGVAVVPVVPLLGVTATLAGVLAAANLLALPAAIAAARIRPASVLRAE
jgi:hypothetical protein